MPLSTHNSINDATAHHRNLRRTLNVNTSLQLHELVTMKPWGSLLLVVVAGLCILTCSFFSYMHGRHTALYQTPRDEFAFYYDLLSSRRVPTNTPLYEFVKLRYYQMTLLIPMSDLHHMYLDAGPVDTQLLANIPCSIEIPADQEYYYFLKRASQLQQDGR